MRVVSLLPSATELLCAAGGADLLVGRSHECDYPPGVRALPAVTGQRIEGASSAEIDRFVREALRGDAGGAGLYTLDADLLRSLAPDLILTQDACAVCSIDLAAVGRVAAMLRPEPVILSLDPVSLDDVFDDLLRIGGAIGRSAAAHLAVIELRGAYWSAVDYVNPYASRAEVAVLEWMDPLFVAGRWVPPLVEAAGGRCSLGEAGAPSRRIEPESLVAAAPERLIICPCGFDIATIRRELPALTNAPWWPDLPAARAGRVALVDGVHMLNRPGPRLVDAFRWLVSWLNEREEVRPEGFPVEEA